MNNPGHNETFNKDAERVDREKEQSHQHVPSATGDVSHQIERRLFRGGKLTGRGMDVLNSMRDLTGLPPVERTEEPARTYREELETNDDGTPNVMFSKE